MRDNGDNAKDQQSAVTSPWASKKLQTALERASLDFATDKGGTENRRVQETQERPCGTKRSSHRNAWERGTTGQQTETGIEGVGGM